MADEIIEQKKCTRCDEEKLLDSFPADKRRKDGLYPYCRSCHVLKQASYRRQKATGELNGHKCLMCFEPIRGHPNRRFCGDYCKGRAGRITKDFQLSLYEYRAILDDCGGLCPICRCQMPKRPIDHNHETLEVTGIVCTKCNIGLLAYSNHDPEIAYRLWQYLLDPPARRVTGRVVTVNPASFVNKKSALHKIWRHAA